MKLSDLLKKYREENKISQREFARRCDLSNSLISIIEMGKNPQTGKEISPDLETYQKLALGMRISMQELFEKLGSDATVQLVTIGDDGKVFHHPLQYNYDSDAEILEALHLNPKLRMLFDKQKDLNASKLDAVMAVVDAITKEREPDE